MKDLTNPTILTHHEIKNIVGGSDEGCGGYDICYVRATDSNGGFEYPAPFYSMSCTEQSAAANELCLYALDHGYTRCTYDCECDGLHH